PGPLRNNRVCHNGSSSQGRPGDYGFNHVDSITYEFLDDTLDMQFRCVEEGYAGISSTQYQREFRPPRISPSIPSSSLNRSTIDSRRCRVSGRKMLFSNSPQRKHPPFVDTVDEHPGGMSVPHLAAIFGY